LLSENREERDRKRNAFLINIFSFVIEELEDKEIVAMADKCRAMNYVEAACYLYNMGYEFVQCV
jgi:hypothetical protein